MIEHPPDGVERRPITSAARILMSGPVALVTTRDKGENNVLPIAWHMPLSLDPCLVGIAVEQSRHSLDMIRASEQFAINIPTRTLLHHVQYLGGYTGEDIDKFEATQLEVFTPTHVEAPLLQHCAAWIECELQDTVVLGDHELCIGLVVAVHVDVEAFDERWLLRSDHHSPLHYLGGNEYAQPGQVLEARVPRSFEAPEQILAERIAEELELTEEARERRAEQLDAVQREVDAGNVVDLASLADDELPDLDLSAGIVIGEQPPGPSEE
ncbi:MAG: flavin reductase family protein [Chloroflexi bacterium]|nr:flavin reductase family protein [Chloroflexota bacterium]